MKFVENGSNLDYKELNHRHIQDTFVANLCAAAALTWVLYDFILCFDQELALVWGRWREHKGRHSRRIYVIVRYFSILNLAWYVGINTRQDLGQNVCQTWHYILVINVAIITLLPDVIVLIRINAVYDWNHITLLTCISLFLIQTATGLGVGVLAVLTDETPRPSIGFPIVGCPLGQPKYHPIIALAAWIPSVAAQGIYFLMMLAIFIRVLQSLDPNRRVNFLESLLQVRRVVPTMVTFIGHGLCYFFIAIATKIVNAVVVVNVSGPLRGVGIPIMMALYPVLTARTYLSMVAYLHAAPDYIESEQMTFAVRSAESNEPEED